MGRRVGAIACSPVWPASHGWIGAKIEPQGCSKIGDQIFLVINVTSKFGTDVNYYLNQETFVLERIRTVRPPHPTVDPTPIAIEERWSDFRWVEGYCIPLPSVWLRRMVARGGSIREANQDKRMPGIKNERMRHARRVRKPKDVPAIVVSVSLFPIIRLIGGIVFASRRATVLASLAGARSSVKNLTISLVPWNIGAVVLLWRR